jgi:hypothetical protein
MRAGNSRSLLGKDEQQSVQASLFAADGELPDADPYGVSTKPDMPWEPQAPITPFTTKKGMPVGNSVEEEEDEKGKLFVKQEIVEAFHNAGAVVSGKGGVRGGPAGGVKTGKNDTGDPRDPTAAKELHEDDSDDDDGYNHLSETSDDDSGSESDAESDHNYHQPPPAKKSRKDAVDL